MSRKAGAVADAGVDNGAFKAPLAAANLSVDFSTKVMAEFAHLWAKRMRAVADQIEAVAECKEPTSLVQIQIEFMKRAQADYAEGVQALQELLQRGAPRV